MDLPVDPYDLRWEYPLFVVAERIQTQLGFVVVEVDANDCILLYRNREVVELYVEQSQQAGHKDPL